MFFEIMNYILRHGVVSRGGGEDETDTAMSTFAVERWLPFSTVGELGV